MADNDWRGGLKAYIKLEKIGEGTYGIVFKAQVRADNSLVAIKQIRLESEDEGIPVTALREISVLRELQHPNIIELSDVIMEGSRLYLVFPFLTMDLKRFMDTYKNKTITDIKLQKSFTYQMIQGVCYCHQRRILHRDLKPQNILVDASTLCIKLADFGLSRAVGIPIRPYTHEIVTLWYRSPEVLMNGARYSTGVDTWSVGCIFAELARGRPLFAGDSEIDQLFRVFKCLGTPTEENWHGVTLFPEYKANFPRWPGGGLQKKMQSYLDSNGLDLLERTLIYEPMKRISAKEMLRHPFFDDLDKSTLPAADYDGTLVLD